MAISINSTPGDESNNSYISAAAMATYVADQVISASVQTAWSALSPNLKALYLTRASKFLDGLVVWIGTRASSEQGLSWPRYDAWVDERHISSDIFPVPVIEATAELALWMMGNSGAVSSSGSSQAQFSEIEVGPLRIDFNNTVTAVGTSEDYFPDIVAILLKGYGQIDNPNLPSAGKAHNVRLVRA